jgi:hypothetical protein
MIFNKHILNKGDYVNRNINKVHKVSYFLNYLLKDISKAVHAPFLTKKMGAYTALVYNYV